MLITHSCFAPIEYSHALRSASFQQWPATRHKHHCATLREGNVARKRRFHETLRGRSRIDFPIRPSRDEKDVGERRAFTHRRHADAESELLGRGDPLPRLRKCRLFRKRPPPRLCNALVNWNGQPAAASAARTSNTPSGSRERAAFSSTGSWSPAPR